MLSTVPGAAGGGSAAPRLFYGSQASPAMTGFPRYAWPDAARAQLAVAGSLPTLLQPPSKFPSSLWVTRTLVTEDLVLLGDPWVFSALATTPSVALGRGAFVSLPSRKTAGAWRVRRPVNAAETAAIANADESLLADLARTGCNATLDGTAAGTAECAPTPSGYVFSVTSTTWTLVGLPALAFYGSGGLAGGSSLPSAHVLTVVGGATARAVIPGNTLRAGYVYNISLSATHAVSWSFALGQTAWDADVSNALSSDAAAALSAAFPTGRRRVQSTASVVAANIAVYSATDVHTLAGTAAAAHAPVMFAHVPPVSGIVSTTPTSGVSGSTQFSLASVNWASPDALVLNETAAPVGASAATSLLAALPLPPAVAAVAATAWLTADSSSDALSSALADGGCDFDAIEGVAQPWTVFLDALGAPLSASASSVCTSIVSTAALSLSTAAYTPRTPQLSFSVRALDGSVSSAATAAFGAGVIVSNTNNNVGRPLTWQSNLAASNALRSPQSWPGFPLYPLLTNVTGTATRLSLPVAATSSGTVTVLVVAVDAMGAAGAALVGVPLTLSAAPPSGDPNALSSLAATAIASVGPAQVTANPYAALAALASIASTLSAAASSTPLSGSASAATAATASLSASTRDSILSVVALALNTMNATAGFVDDATLTRALSATAMITNGTRGGLGGANSTAGAAVMSPSTAASAFTALNLVLTLAASSAQAQGVSTGGVASSSSSSSLPPSLSPALGTFALTTLSNLLVADASTTGETGSSSVAPPAPSASTLASVSAALGLLTDAALRSVPASGGTVTLSSAVVNGAASYCGPGMVLTAARVAVGAQTASISIPAPLPPCSSTTKPVTVPASLVAAIPAPAVVLSPALMTALAAGAATTGTAAFDLSLIQYGVSPVSESSGAGAVSYTPLAAPNTLASAAAAVASNKTAGSARKAQVSANGGTSSAYAAAPAQDGGVVATAAALAGALASTGGSHDLFAARGSDARSLGIDMRVNGRSVAPTLVNAPFLYTVPIRDPSIVVWKGSADASTVDVGNGAVVSPQIILTCPTSPAAAAASIAAQYSAPADIAGQRARAVLRSATPIAFNQLGSQRVETPPTLPSGASFGAAAVSSEAAGVALSAAAVPSPVSAAVGAFAYVVDVDCGALLGTQSLACGPGAEGTMITFNCPRAVAVPMCLLFDTNTSAWSSNFCTIVNKTALSVTCACDRTGLVSLRYGAVPVSENTLFASDAPVLWGDPRFIFGVAVFVLCVMATAAAAAGACVSQSVEKQRSARWAAALEGDVEVDWWKRRRLGAGRVWVFDRLADVAAGATRSATAGKKESATVVPLPISSTAAEKNTPQLTAWDAAVADVEATPTTTPELAALWLLFALPLEPLRAMWMSSEEASAATAKKNETARRLPPAVAAALARLTMRPPQETLSARAARFGPLLYTIFKLRACSARSDGWFSPFTRFDARAPALARSLVEPAAVLAGLFAAAVAFSATSSNADTLRLPPLRGESWLLVMLAACVGTAVVRCGLVLAVRVGGAAEARWRYPLLEADAAARSKVGRQDRPLRESLAVLRVAGADALPAGTPLALVRAVRLGVLPPTIASAASRMRAAERATERAMAAAEEASRTGAATGATPLSRAARVATPAARAAASANMLADAAEAAWVEEAGWVEPSRTCVSRCGFFLRWRHRHPSQRAVAFAAWVSAIRGGARGTSALARAPHARRHTQQFASASVAPAYITDEDFYGGRGSDGGVDFGDDDDDFPTPRGFMKQHWEKGGGGGSSARGRAVIVPTETELETALAATRLISLDSLLLEDPVKRHDAEKAASSAAAAERDGNLIAAESARAAAAAADALAEEHAIATALAAVAAAHDELERVELARILADGEPEDDLSRADRVARFSAARVAASATATEKARAESRAKAERERGGGVDDSVAGTTEGGRADGDGARTSVRLFSRCVLAASATGALAAAQLLVIIVALVSCYYAALFGVIRGGTAASDLAVAWVVGVVVESLVVRPGITAVSLYGSVLVAPDAAREVAGVPAADALARDLARRTLHPATSRGGRLAIVARFRADATAMGCSPAEALALSVSLWDLTVALNGRAMPAAALAAVAAARATTQTTTQTTLATAPTGNGISSRRLIMGARLTAADALTAFIAAEENRPASVSGSSAQALPQLALENVTAATPPRAASRPTVAAATPRALSQSAAAVRAATEAAKATSDAADVADALAARAAIDVIVYAHALVPPPAGRSAECFSPLPESDDEAFVAALDVSGPVRTGDSASALPEGGLGAVATALSSGVSAGLREADPSPTHSVASSRTSTVLAATRGRSSRGGDDSDAIVAFMNNDSSAVVAVSGSPMLSSPPPTLLGAGVGLGGGAAQQTTPPRRGLSNRAATGGGATAPAANGPQSPGLTDAEAGFAPSRITSDTLSAAARASFRQHAPIAPLRAPGLDRGLLPLRSLGSASIAARVLGQGATARLSGVPRSLVLQSTAAADSAGTEARSPMSAQQSAATTRLGAVAEASPPESPRMQRDTPTAPTSPVLAGAPQSASLEASPRPIRSLSPVHFRQNPRDEPVPRSTSGSPVRAPRVAPESPRAVRAESPRAVGAESPRAAGAESPRAVAAESPRAAGAPANQPQTSHAPPRFSLPHHTGGVASGASATPHTPHFSLLAGLGVQADSDEEPIDSSPLARMILQRRTGDQAAPQAPHFPLNRIPLPGGMLREMPSSRQSSRASTQSSASFSRGAGGGVAAHRAPPPQSLFTGTAFDSDEDDGPSGPPNALAFASTIVRGGGRAQRPN